MIRPVAEGLVMQQLLYAAEVRPISEVEIPKTEVRPAELALATQLIEQQAAAAFDPSAYTDEVKTRIEAAVQKKVDGQEIAVAEEATAPTAQVIDLMEALRASLKKKAPEAAKPAAQAAARKPPKRAEQDVPPAKRASRK
jgi:DNA end-binding protein Ku